MENFAHVSYARAPLYVSPQPLAFPRLGDGPSSARITATRCSSPCLMRRSASSCAHLRSGRFCLQQARSQHPRHPLGQVPQRQLPLRAPRQRHHTSFLTQWVNTPAQQSRVISSQKLLYRSVCILRAVFSAGGHVSLEQPTNAMSWLEPFVQDLLSEFQARLVNIPACTVGQDIAKSWLFACSYTRLCSLAGTCTHKGGHISVAGLRDAQGAFLSQRTAEYPVPLAAGFAEAVCALFPYRSGVREREPCSLSAALRAIPVKPRTRPPNRSSGWRRDLLTSRLVRCSQVSGRPTSRSSTGMAKMACGKTHPGSPTQACRRCNK